jgi:hypothetical protein
VAKFAMGVGVGTWKLKAQFSKAIDKDSEETVPLKLNVYLDENWEAVLDQDSCTEKLG